MRRRAGASRAITHPVDARADRNAFRDLPQLQRLLESAAATALIAEHGRAPVVEALRRALDGARTAIAGGEAAAGAGELLSMAAADLRSAARPALRRVINATGVVLHTNLGRAPLPAAALDAVAEVGRGYSNLEYDLEAGARGRRTAGVEPLLCELTGASAAFAVNNAAAAVLLALAGHAGGGAEVVVSRGELVEIGGGFRIPEVIAQGGARLVEVGTTNRTRLADYAAAVTERTRVLLKVHPSNYRVTGFTEEAPLAELSELARARGLVLMHDLGSGALTAASGRPHEPTVRASLEAGCDLVAFSGDKLMGGPQAGLLVGTEAAVAALRRHPLARAVRCDKLTLAALEAVLRLHRDPARAAREIPVLRMLAQTPAALQARAERLAAALPSGLEATVEVSEAYAGGGSLPGEAMESRAVVLSASDGPDALAGRLRGGDPAVVARVAHGRVWLDVLTVADGEVEALAAAVARAERA